MPALGGGRERAGSVEHSPQEGTALGTVDSLPCGEEKLEEGQGRAL